LESDFGDGRTDQTRVGLVQPNPPGPDSSDWISILRTRSISLSSTVRSPHTMHIFFGSSNLLDDPNALPIWPSEGRSLFFRCRRFFIIVESRSQEAFSVVNFGLNTLDQGRNLHNLIRTLRPGSQPNSDNPCHLVDWKYAEDLRSTFLLVPFDRCREHQPKGQAVPIEASCTGGPLRGSL
jgi:hypothetical protein